MLPALFPVGVLSPSACRPWQDGDPRRHRHGPPVSGRAGSRVQRRGGVPGGGCGHGGALTPAARPRHRMPREQWWLNLRLMLKMLAHYRISMADYVSGELEHVTRRTLSIDKGF